MFRLALGRGHETTITPTRRSRGARRVKAVRKQRSKNSSAIEAVRSNVANNPERMTEAGRKGRRNSHVARLNLILAAPVNLVMAEAMKIAVLGATSRTGEQIVRQGIAAGYAVTAVLSRGEAMSADPKPRVISGDVFDAAFLCSAVTAGDAVLSALDGCERNRPTTVYSASTVAAIDAMHEIGVRRFIGVTAAPMAPKGQTSTLNRLIVYPILYRFFGAAYDDMRRMESMLAASDLEWTVFRPPHLLDLPATGRYRIAVDVPLSRALSVSRADLAAAMLASINDRRLFKHAVQIAE